MVTNTRQTTLLLPLAIVLGVYLLFQLFLLNNVSIAQYDESIYLDVARNIRKTGLPLRSVGLDGRYHFDHLPLYVYLLSGMTTLFGQNTFLVRLVTMLAGAAGVTITGIIGLRAKDTAAGFVAALLLALNSFFATYAYFIREEVFFAFFVLLASYYLLRLGQTQENRYLFAAALSIGVAFLLKEIALVFLTAAALYVFFFLRTTVKWPDWRGRITAILVLSLPAITSLVAWLLWANAIDAAQLQVTLDRWFGTGTPIIDPRIGLSARAWLETIIKFVFGWELALLLLFALLYTLLRRRKPPHIAYLFLLYLGVALGASFMMNLKETRHLMALIPSICLLIGLLLPWSSWWVWLTEDRRRLLVAAPLILLFLLSASPLKLPTSGYWRDPAARWDPTSWWDPIYGDRLLHNDNALSLAKEAGEYLATAEPRDGLITIVRQGPIVGYYAARPYLFLFPRPFEENMDILGRSDYVVVDAVEFWLQTPEETEIVMQYISDNFIVDQVLQDGSGQVTIYQRNNH
jgi:4-amino-4-deoxy-L-arabinose transferase-like glycosyltransferase